MHLPVPATQPMLGRSLASLSAAIHQQIFASFINKSSKHICDFVNTALLSGGMILIINKLQRSFV